MDDLPPPPAPRTRAIPPPPEALPQLEGPTELVQAGSSLKFLKIAEGLADIYPRLGPTCEWDTAAAHAVVLGVGGSVKDPDGVELRYGKDDILNPHFIVRGP